MELKDAILDLRESLSLSQDGFASKLFVTRQAVSRWENGETVPNTDTLQRISSTYNISIDSLLGHPAGQCQSCGMMLENDGDKGTEQNGEKSMEYCTFCYQQGMFTEDLTMEQMVEHNIRDLDEWKKENGMCLSEEEARAMLMEFLPTLSRWQKAP